MARVNLIQLRGGTAAAWTSANPVLADKEPGVETDTRRFKFGDGVTAWNSLAYASADAHFKGVYVDDTALTAAHPTAEPGDYAYIDAGVGQEVQLWIWDEDDTEWVESGSPAGGTWGSITGTLSSQTDLQNALNAKLNCIPTFRTVTATHELDATDLATVNAGGQLEIFLDSASPITLELPTNAVRAFPIGTTGSGVQYGAGQVTIVPDATVTMRSPNNANKSFAQYSKFYYEKIGINEWLLSGDITV
jgi:hypothetical protein